jgi:hypothetical protein
MMGQKTDEGRTIGQRAAQARHYYDQYIPIEQAALLMGVAISALKEAARTADKINGIAAPKIKKVTPAGKLYFDGLDIEAWINDKHDHESR